MKKIILTKEESYNLGQIHSRANYAFYRESYETYNSLHLEYLDELVRIKEKYGIDTHTGIAKVDFTSQYLLVEDNIYGDL
jgi:hypothetical protein